MCENVPNWSPAHYWQKKKKTSLNTSFFPITFNKIYSFRLYICMIYNISVTFLKEITCSISVINLNLCSEIFNAEVLFREDCTSDEFVDVILGSRVYMPCLYVSK